MKYSTNYLDIPDPSAARLAREFIVGTESVREVDREVAERLSHDPVTIAPRKTQ